VSPFCWTPCHSASPRLPHAPFSILTATVLVWSGWEGSIPKASARTTCPKQPSPKGFPSTSLETKKAYALDLWVPLQVLHPLLTPLTFGVPVPGKLPQWIKRQV
jgi:hypothetical protein